MRDVRQVFRSYDRRPQPTGTALEFRYCPKCRADLRALNHDSRRRRCESCGFVQYLNPLPGVSAIVADGGKVLLGRRLSGATHGTWCLPCGFIDFSETFLEAVHREVHEETNLLIEIDSIVHVGSNQLSPDRHFFVVVCLANVIGGTPAPGDDIAELMWVSAGDALPDLAFDADRYVIDRFFDGSLPRIDIDPQYRRWTPAGRRG